MIVALYARVSTTKQADMNLSIPDQLRQMQDWCKANGHSVAETYIEPGASATTDHRPKFQQMMDDACRKPSPFDAILVHSFSRFFRNQGESWLYERKLEKFGVTVISITQPAGDDDSGFVVRSVYKMVDELQSRENSKHVSRGMKENARQGYFNGSQPPFGYRKKPVPGGAKGRQKHVLEPDPAEAGMVRAIFDLYLSGRFPGVADIAAHLNARGQTRRGRGWIGQNILNVLSSRAYLGEYYFNRRDPKRKRTRPPEEWIRVELESLVDEETFARAEALRRDRAPAVRAPRQVNTPTLLTGLLRCGACGSPVTLSTGKGGRYRYYNCSRRHREGAEACDSVPVPMEKLDALVLTALAEQVFIPERVKILLREHAKRLEEARGGSQADLQKLTGELQKLEERKTRLFEAVEEGLLPLDESLRDRMRQHEANRQELLAQMAGLRRRGEVAPGKISEKEVKAFCSSLREHLLEDTTFAKAYLRVLVEEIRLDGKSAVMRGTCEALGALVSKKNLGTAAPPDGVPRLGLNGEANL